MNILKPLAVAATLIATLAPAKADSQMKYPNWYAYHYAWVERVLGGRPYFECDFTSQICVKGVLTSGGPRGDLAIFAGVILDARDRSTVLKHIACWQTFQDCNDYGEGMWSYTTPNSKKMTVADMPAYCVEAMRQRGEKCRGYDTCYAGWKCTYSSAPVAKED
jgi:hypothetical protein